MLGVILAAGAVLAVVVLVVFLVVALGIVMYFVGIYNALVRMKNDIGRSFSNIDVLLKQRHDELPKLIETCKGYMQYEQKTLQAVTEARAAYSRATTPGEKAQADNMITGALRTLFAVAENYPDLKANTNFMQLQGRITGLEENIAAQRSRFNEDVNIFNIRIAQIPDVLVARFMNLQPHPLFEVAPADREDVQVKFT
jgi:LemA protein